MSAGYKWKPLRRAQALPPSAELVGAWMAHHKCTSDEALRLMEAYQATTELWKNDLYQVEVRRFPEDGYVHLNIRRVDGYPGREWRHFQQIKNELVGAECEGMELYPAESRLVDTTNKYHLYVNIDPTYRFPVGFENRDVQYGSVSQGGLRQQPAMKVRS